MGETNRGFQGVEVIRKVCGSPAVTYTFSSTVEQVDIANLGGVSDIFYSLSTTALNSYAGSVGSGMGILWSGGELSHTTLPARVSSVSIIGSGTGSPFVQVTGYY